MVTIAVIQDPPARRPTCSVQSNSSLTVAYKLHSTNISSTQTVELKERWWNLLETAALLES